jgi:hypothetical protein
MTQLHTAASILAPRSLKEYIGKAGVLASVKFFKEPEHSNHKT